VVDQPDAVLRAAEEVSGLVHGRRVDGEDDRAAVPRADPPRGLGVGREVHAMARHAEQALPRDAVRGAVARAVVEDGGGFDRLKLQVDVHAVALVGADQCAGRVEREAFLIVMLPDRGILPTCARDARAVVARVPSSVVAGPGSKMTDSSIRVRSVSLPATSRQIGGYLVEPEGDGPFPAVVVIHEAYGLNENIKDVARRFRGQGYAALAVDLFAGRNRAVCMARLFGGMLSNALDHEGIRDLKAALTFLTAQPRIDAQRLGAIGFCMGGGLAIAWACTDNRLKAIAPFYGMNPRPLDAVARSCPVVGSYPARDFTAGAGRKLDAALARHGIAHDIKIYPGALHSFFNDRGRSYNAAAAQDSWERVLAFFNEHLRATE